MRGVRNMLFQRPLMETLLSTGCVSADSMILHKRKSTHTSEGWISPRWKC